jgi:CRISPR type I-A-associated protein Csa5
MSKVEDADIVPNYKTVANSLAILTIATQGYTHLDRLANALNPQTVAKVIYDVERSVSALLSRKAKDIKIVKEKVKKKDKEYTSLQLITDFAGEGSRTYDFYGLPKDDDIYRFIEESTKDLNIARKVAAYAISLVANQKFRQSAYKNNSSN